MAKNKSGNIVIDMDSFNLDGTAIIHLKNVPAHKSKNGEITVRLEDVVKKLKEFPILYKESVSKK
jgi:hypothetical protein